MQRFDSAGVHVAYIDEGSGDPIILIHGFASNSTVNWRNTNWIKTLNGAGFRVIAVDNRGHGQSEKLYDPSQYGAATMAEDVRRLMDHLDIARADLNHVAVTLHQIHTSFVECFGNDFQSVDIAHFSQNLQALFT